jgi:hypothetical protein
LPSPDGDEDWRPYAITCDETYAYIIWNQVDVAAAVNYSDFQIQAYRLSDWTVKTGWPATGTTLHNGGGTQESSQVITATDDLLAVANYTQSVSVSTDPAVYLVDKADGSITAYGAGDQTSGDGPHKIASNGTYIFTDTGYSIDISDPSTGCGGTNWPLSISGNAAGVACVGDLVVFSQDNGVAPDPVCYIASVGNSDIGLIDPTAEAVCSGLASVITDGLYFWAYGLRTIGSTVRATMFKIDPYQALNEDGTTVGEFDEALLTSISFDFSASGHPTTVGWNIPRLVFDGEAIWTTLTTTNDGVFRRVSRINLR